MELRTMRSADAPHIRRTLEREGWTPRQIEGQLDAATKLSSAADGFVAVADKDGSFTGFVSVQFHTWNRLAQIHGLVVVANHKREGVGSHLVDSAESFARERAARGIYVDTPVDNRAALSFYRANGYRELYRMPRYYDDDLDGVTLAKFFDAERS